MNMPAAAAAPGSAAVLSGPQKVAAVALALGHEHAARLLERFSEEERHRIVRAMVEMGRIGSETVERLLANFVDELDGETIFGSMAEAQRILLRLMPPEKARSFLDQIRDAGGYDTWEKLRGISDGTLAAFLRSEHPQTSALVITRLGAAQAARILMQLPKPLAEEIVQRTLAMTPVARPVLEDVEQVLREEFLVHGDRRSTDSHALVAEILNELDSQSEAAMLASLERSMPESAERVRNLMFAFEDLTDLDETGLDILLRNIPAEQLPLALKGASTEMTELFLRGMPERAARMLRDEIATMPRVRAREVEAARRQIVNICKQLIAAGEITVSDKEEGDWVT